MAQLFYKQGITIALLAQAAASGHVMSTTRWVWIARGLSASVTARLDREAWLLRTLNGGGWQQHAVTNLNASRRHVHDSIVMG